MSPRGCDPQNVLSVNIDPQKMQGHFEMEMAVLVEQDLMHSEMKKGGSYPPFPNPALHLKMNGPFHQGLSPGHGPSHAPSVNRSQIETHLVVCVLVFDVVGALFRVFVIKTGAQPVLDPVIKANGPQVIVVLLRVDGR